VGAGALGEEERRAEGVAAATAKAAEPAGVEGRTEGKAEAATEAAAAGVEQRGVLGVGERRGAGKAKGLGEVGRELACRDRGEVSRELLAPPGDSPWLVGAHPRPHPLPRPTPKLVSRPPLPDSPCRPGECTRESRRIVSPASLCQPWLQAAPPSAAGGTLSEGCTRESRRISLLTMRSSRSSRMGGRSLLGTVALKIAGGAKPSSELSVCRLLARPGVTSPLFMYCASAP